MQEIEKQVREALTIKYANAIYEVFNSPEYKESIQTCAKKVAEAFVRTIGAIDNMDDDDEQDRESISSNPKPKDIIEEQMNAMFSSPEKLNQAAHTYAKNKWLCRADCESLAEDNYKKLTKDGDFGQDALEALKKADEKIFRFVDLQDQIVAEIVKVAEIGGIEKAITDESEYAAIRAIIPTSDEYLAHALSGSQALKQYFADSQKAMLMDGEVGKVMGALFEGMQKIMEEMEETTGQLIKENFFKYAKKIYGQ